MRMVLPAVLLMGCGGDGASDTDGGPDSTDTEDTDVVDPTGCVSGAIGLDGGTIDTDGASLAFPSGSFVATTTVELCPVPSTDSLIPGPIWYITPETDLAAPAILTLEHDGDEVSSQLFTPWWDGSPLRSLQSTRPSPGSLSAPVYRLGANWVASDPRLAEAWAPSDNDRADILFVVESSSAAGTVPTQLAGLASSLVTALGPSGLDYHVGVVTADLDNASQMGKLRAYQGARWIDPTSSNAEGTLAALLDVGTAGSDTIQGLGAASVALGPELSMTDNADFQRIDASLAVVFVASSDDQTAPSVVTPATFPTGMELLKGPWASAVAHGIVPVTSTWADVIDDMGGTRTSVAGNTGDWLTLLEDLIAGIGLGDGGLVLSEPATGGSIQVWWVPADEEPVRLQAPNIRFDPEDNEVLVEPGSFPADELVVLYEPY